jgi:serine protease Do
MNDMISTMRSRKLLSLTVILFTLATGVVLGTLITGGVRAARDQVAPGATPLAIPAPAQLSSAFVQVAKIVEPAVVNINTESTVKNHPKVSPKQRQRTPRDQDPNPFDDFFDRFFGGQGAPSGDVKTRGLGSGIIVDSKGYILTNRHVAAEADRIKVKIQGDSTQYDAKVVGMDEETDLAVIKIEPKKPLVAAKMGNSDGMSVGDWVLAIGSPFGLDATVTAGIISARGRDISGSSFQHFLQTDAAINPGNSGGPLVNMAGEVIGINTAIYTSRGSYEGVGFALPSNMAVGVYNQIIKSGRVSRGSIGILFNRDENPSALHVYGAKEGVLITNVLDGTPAEKAGLKAGDVITAVNGTAIHDGNQLVDKISQLAIGDKAQVRFLRDGKEQTQSVGIGDRAEVVNGSGQGQEKEGGDAKGSGDGKFGIQIRALTPEMATRMGVANATGVLVVEVESGSFAEDIGVARGDIITEINRKPVKSNQDVTAIQKDLKSGDDVAFRVLRRGQNRMDTFFLAGPLP